MSNNRLDVIIFGATGFTGKYTVKEAARLSKQGEFKFGIAGRRKEALETVVKEFAPNIENVPIIIADLKDEKSLINMTEQAKVIVNCCGPYRFYGEAVIKACVDTKTHHVDVSGEPQYMESMQLKYNEAAQKAGIYIVSACGADSVPCDLGVIFTQQKFGGEVNSIETYINVWFTKDTTGGAVIHYGTWESAVYGIAHYNELRPLRTKLFPNKLPELQPKLKHRGIVHRSPVSEGWSVPFLGSDRSVVLRTQRFLYEKYKQRPAQVQCYVTSKSLFSVFFLGIVAVVFTLMSKFECGRNLLLKYPSFFSGGLASHAGPMPEDMNNLCFSITFKAIGWPEKLSEPSDKHVDSPKKEVITKVSGVNPAYGLTCTSLMLSALTILKDSDNMPDNGGVLPPGAAFHQTSLIESLNRNGLTFEVVSTSVQK